MACVYTVCVCVCVCILFSYPHWPNCLLNGALEIKFTSHQSKPNIKTFQSNIYRNREHLYVVFYKTCKEFVIQLFLKKMHICHYRTGLHNDEHYLNSKMDYSFILYTNALVFSTLFSIELVT